MENIDKNELDSGNFILALSNESFIFKYNSLNKIYCTISAMHAMFSCVLQKEKTEAHPVIC